MSINSGKINLLGRDYIVFGDDNDTQFNEFIKNGTWAEFNLTFLKKIISKNSVCLDVGANLGMMSLAMSSIATFGHVYAIEPSPRTSEALIRTVFENGINNISIHPICITNVDGPVKFFEIEKVSTSSFSVSLDNPRNVSTIYNDTSLLLTLHARSLDSLIQELNIKKIDIIKIDVEGSELEVLEGMKKVLLRDRPIVLLEFNSYTFIQVREILPRQALMKIFDIFDFIYYFENRTGDLVRLENSEISISEFLHNNLFGGFVDDLLCSFSDLPIEAE